MLNQKIAFFAPIVAASFLHSFSDLSPLAVSLSALALVALLSLFSIVGKLVRDDPDESVKAALLIGLASGLLATVSAFAVEVANPFIILSAAMVAAYKGPVYLRKKTEDSNQKDK